MDNPVRKPGRGFASLTPERQREIASKGGKAAHQMGTAHEFTSNEAAEAARIGHSKGTLHEFNSEEARIAGRKGGLARAAKMRAAAMAKHQAQSAAPQTAAAASPEA